jgi:hypothetical protein
MKLEAKLERRRRRKKKKKKKKISFCQFLQKFLSKNKYIINKKIFSPTLLT